MVPPITEQSQAFQFNTNKQKKEMSRNKESKQKVFPYQRQES